jgi:hypothetical protein
MFTTGNSTLKQHIILLTICVSLTTLFSCIGEQKTVVQEKRNDEFFSSFEGEDGFSARYRVGAESDSSRFNFTIKAITTAWFDSIRYDTKTVYILKHSCGDSIVIHTKDKPLLSHSEFARYYYANKAYARADTILRYDIISHFYIEPKGVVAIDSIDTYPFMFMDVNFSGNPALLVRDYGYQGYYSYTVYKISAAGFKEIHDAPFNKIENRANSWCLGGSTVFDYKNKTISTHMLAPGSCSDYGTSITQVFTLNPSTDRFDMKQIENKYDFASD